MNGEKMNKAFLAFGVAGVLTYCVPTMPTKAIDTNTEITYSTEAGTRATGLIYQYYLGVSASNGDLIVSGYTRSSNTMKSIGYKDLVVERSKDGVNWSDDTEIGDKLTSSATSYYLNDYSVSVDGGYYYRVSGKHYAKESGLFGSSQSIDNTSNVVYIS